eukprot:jgi/Mesen1/8123/ME000437S07219
MSKRIFFSQTSEGMNLSVKQTVPVEKREEAEKSVKTVTGVAESLPVHRVGVEPGLGDPKTKDDPSLDKYRPEFAIRTEDERCSRLQESQGLWIATSSFECISHINTHVNQAGATDYEVAVLESILAWSRGSTSEMFETHRQLVRRFPRDLGALKRAQTLAFYCGRADIMLELADVAVGANRGRAFVDGMRAFALLECGRAHQAEAEASARQGLAICPHDAWAQHAVSIPASPGAHAVVGRQLEQLLLLHDQLNALGLLLRLDLRDLTTCVDSRLPDVVQHAACHEVGGRDLLLELLVVWALARLRRSHDVAKLIESLESLVHGQESERRATLKLGFLPMVRAMAARGEDDPASVCRHLAPPYNISHLKAIGASEEQLDVFEEVRLVALLCHGRAEEASEELRRRTERRPGVAFMLHLQVKACGLNGDGVLAAPA